MLPEFRGLLRHYVPRNDFKQKNRVRRPQPGNPAAQDHPTGRCFLSDLTGYGGRSLHGTRLWATHTASLKSANHGPGSGMALTYALIAVSKKNPPQRRVVELSGIEPLTYALRTHRSPN